MFDVAVLYSLALALALQGFSQAPPAPSVPAGSTLVVVKTTAEVAQQVRRDPNTPITICQRGRPPFTRSVIRAHLCSPEGEQCRALAALPNDHLVQFLNAYDFDDPPTAVLNSADCP